MKHNLLYIPVSPRIETSLSRLIGAELLQKLKQKYEIEKITERDLGRNPIAHLTPEQVDAINARPHEYTKEQKELLAFSDLLIDELFAHSIVLIATPMWNLTIPSMLKSWIDHIVRSHRTFQFKNGKPQGLVHHKICYIVLASGGFYSRPPEDQYDFAVPYLKAILGYIGIFDIKIIRVEGLYNPPLKQEAIKNARLAIDKLR